MASTELAIETIELTKVFPDWWGRAKVRAVNALNLRVHMNEIYGFLGPNGSGKTTTIKMLLNLLHPTRGHAFLLGGSSRDPKIAERIGYLPEESYLYKYLTARETLDFYGRLFGLPGPVRAARIDTLLDMVGLSGMDNRAVGTFSKGMMRRIGLAQALINDPDLLILDEPTSGMDPIGTRQIKDLLVELARRGKTILLCSHLLADVEDVCDRIGILYGGTMQVEGSVRELLQHRDETQITTGRLSEATLQKVRAMLESEGGNCRIASPMDKLENYFIAIVSRAQEQQATSGATVGTGISGFLAEKPVSPSRSVLDQLVAARVEEGPGDEEGDKQTEQPQAVSKPAAAQENRRLLEKLVRAEAPVGDDVTEKATPVPEKPAPKPAVRRDLLEELIDRKTSGDAETQTPDAVGGQEDGDA